MGAIEPCIYTCKYRKILSNILNDQRFVYKLNKKGLQNLQPFDF